MSLEEFLKDIFRMPDPGWFSNRWGQIVKEWNEKAEKWDELQKAMPSEELLEKMSEYRLAEKKLEAVKTWQDSLSYSMSPEKWVEKQGELNDILGLNDQSSGETPT